MEYSLILVSFGLLLHAAVDLHSDKFNIIHIDFHTEFLFAL